MANMERRTIVIKVGIVGGTGYTGVELLRLLANHPEVSVEVITSRSEKVCRLLTCSPTFVVTTI